MLRTALVLDGTNVTYTLSSRRWTLAPLGTSKRSTTFQVLALQVPALRTFKHNCILSDFIN